MANSTVTVHVPGNHLMPGLLGPRDELLRLVEDSFPGVIVHVRGNEITASGAQAEQVGSGGEDVGAGRRSHCSLPYGRQCVR